MQGQGKSHRARKKPEQGLQPGERHALHFELHIDQECQWREHRDHAEKGGVNLAIGRQCEKQRNQLRMGDDVSDGARDGQATRHVIINALHMLAQAGVKSCGAGRAGSDGAEKGINHGVPRKVSSIQDDNMVSAVNDSTIIDVVQLNQWLMRISRRLSHPSCPLCEFPSRCA